MPIGYEIGLHYQAAYVHTPVPLLLVVLASCQVSQRPSDSVMAVIHNLSHSTFKPSSFVLSFLICGEQLITLCWIPLLYSPQ